jgi:hypothetical protein
MADPTKLTFGCGEFIPGAGPFGFPDYVPSPGVDGPDDEDPGGGDFCEQDSDCWEDSSVPEPNVVCNTGTGVCQNVTPDPCDGVTCLDSAGEVDACQTCQDGTCICNPAFGACPQNANSPCHQQAPSCKCYPLYIINQLKTTTQISETQYQVQTDFTFNQACYSDTYTQIAGDQTSPSFISKINDPRYVSDTFVEGTDCPVGCPGVRPEGTTQLGCPNVQVTWLETFQSPLQGGPGIIEPNEPGGTGGGGIGGGVPGGGGVANSTAPQEETSTNSNSIIQSVTNSIKSAFRFVTDFAGVQPGANYSLEDSEIKVSKGSREKLYEDNKIGYGSIFKRRIHRSINEIVLTGDSFEDWDSSKIYKLETLDIIGSIQPIFHSNFKSILKTDGSKYSDREIATIIKSKLVDGTLADLDVNHIENLSKVTKIYDRTRITPSVNSETNEVAALALIEQTMIPMTPTSPGITTKIMDNWKTFATDLNKYVEIEIAGVTQKYYINDDDTVVDFPEYKISDGDVLNVSIGGIRYNLPVKSEKSRAYVVPEPARQQALTLLRGNPARTLYVDVDTSANVDFNYSLNIDDDADRQNAYFFKLIPSSTTKTNDNPSTDIITTTEGKYELMDSTTEAGIAEINEYIKYKYNHRSVFLPHDDIIFDYIESASSINMIQQDVLPPQSKDNPDFPLLVRDYPWYLIVVPTNRSDYLESNAKSRIVSYNVEGKNRRQITTKPLIDPGFVTQKSPLFTKTNLSTTNTNVYGNRDVQGRQTEFSLDQDIYKTVYRDSNGTYGRPSEVRLRRKKNGFRIIKEILDELNTNYILGSNPREKTIYKNDLISRMSMREYNLFFGYENSSYLFSLIEKGLFNDIKIVPTSRRKESALRLSPKSKTRLIKRRGAASTIDKFPIIKSTNSGRYLENPDQDTLYSARFRDRDQSDINSRGESSRNS